jgi:hypothetical protein
MHDIAGKKIAELALNNNHPLTLKKCPLLVFFQNTN